MTLPLFGVAKCCEGFSDEFPRTVVRLKSPGATEPFEECDFSLARSAEDISQSVENGRRSIFIVGDSYDVPLPLATLFDRMISLPANFDYLSSGDILGFHVPTKKFRTLFRANSRHNSFLVTERCNNYCLMCSQPPKEIDDRWILDEIKRSLSLVPKETRTLTFTGGEPLSDWADFIEILADCRDLLPNTSIQVLTNGRAFSKSEIVDAWKSVDHPSLIAAIPVYAAVDYLHDYVVQAKGAFDETILGILKLKDRGQRVEVRVVLHAHTAPTIAETSRWIARNLPFVDHVALMGMENTGFALANEQSLWIDPIDYQEALSDGVRTLAASGMKVSVYNLPLCVLERHIWPHAVQSISDWKNGYVEECTKCVEKNKCSGFFTSGRTRFSRGIVPISYS